MRKPSLDVRAALFFHWLWQFLPGGTHVRELVRAIDPEVDRLWKEYEEADGYDPEKR